MKISKELLSEVLGREVKGGRGYIVVNENNVTFAYADEDMWSDINLYELVHKNLKEWAKSKHLFDKINWSDSVEQILKQAEVFRDGRNLF